MTILCLFMYPEQKIHPDMNERNDAYIDIILDEHVILIYWNAYVGDSSLKRDFLKHNLILNHVTSVEGTPYPNYYVHQVA